MSEESGQGPYEETVSEEGEENRTNTPALQGCQVPPNTQGYSFEAGYFWSA